MARRNNNKMTRRQPAVLQINVTLPTGTSYIDLGLCASLLNRRAYKQHNTKWGVAEFEMLGSGSGTVVIGKLPETWVMENAYKKSKALWDKMNDQVLDEEPSIHGKYHDFKVYFDETMSGETIQTSNNLNGKILTPFVGGNSTTARFDGVGDIRGNWDWSKLTIPNDPTSGDTSEYFMHVIGSDAAGSKGLIHGYGLSRTRPQAQDPNTPLAGGWMNDLFDVGEQLEELRTNLEDDNDRPPYAVAPHGSAVEAYPGGDSEFVGPQVHSFCNFTTTTVSGKNRIQGGMFNLGLIKVENNTGSEVNTIIHMMPGNHRGYLVGEMC